MNYIKILQDSIDTSISINLFKNRKESSFEHIFNSVLVMFPLSAINGVNNFDSNRLQKSAIKAYPLTNRPRGKNDISSVKYHQKQIKENKKVEPIWMIKKNGKYTLLDGAHRIVSSYIENQKFIPCYVINK